MKGLGAIIPIGTALIFGVGLGWVAKGSHLTFFFSHYVPALVTLLAAFLGAKYAFDFQSNREKEEQRKKDMMHGELAIFKLSLMLNSLLSYQREIIEPVRNNPNAFLEMPPTIPRVKEHSTINFDSLAFLLRSDGKNILGELAMEVLRYDAAFLSINERSKVHRDEAQPTLESRGLINDGNHSDESIISALGDRLYFTLCNATDQVIYHVDSTIVSMEEVAAKLTILLEEQFPDENITGISLPKK